MEEKKNLTASEYFDKIKSLKNENSDEALDKFYDASLVMLNKYKRAGQKKMMKKVMFIIDNITKERELVKKGINIFIYKEDIEDYINEVENKDVKIIEASNYPREIPDELIDIMEDTREIFSDFYILFTDYNGKEEKKIAKERREKDPILFGAFKHNGELYERFYFLGDWVDEYCDLTLEKLLKEAGEQIAKTITTPINKEELMLEYQRLKENPTPDTDYTWTVQTNNVSITDVMYYNKNENDNNRIKEVKKDVKFFDKVKTYFSRKKN